MAMTKKEFTEVFENPDPKKQKISDLIFASRLALGYLDASDQTEIVKRETKNIRAILRDAISEAKNLDTETRYESAIKKIVKALAIHHKERHDNPDLYTAIYEIARDVLNEK